MSIYLEINKQLNYRLQWAATVNFENRISEVPNFILHWKNFFYRRYHKNKIKLEVQKNKKGPPRDWKDKKGEGND